MKNEGVLKLYSIKLMINLLYKINYMLQLKCNFHKTLFNVKLMCLQKLRFWCICNKNFYLIQHISN